MAKKHKILIGWLGFIFVCLHISILFVYAAPRQVIPDKTKKAVVPYVEPLFRQKWAMFAPCPVVGGQLKYRLIYEQDTTDWEYKFADAAEWHAVLRGSHHSDLMLLESNLVFWVNYELENLGMGLNHRMTPNEDEIFRESEAYLLNYRLAKGLARQAEQYPIEVEIAYELENVKTGEEGVFYLPAIKV